MMIELASLIGNKKDSREQKICTISTLVLALLLKMPLNKRFPNKTLHYVTCKIINYYLT